MNDKTVIITGATGDIGCAIAEALAADGWRLVLHYHHNEKAAAELAERFDGISVQGDLAARGVAKNVVDAALETYGHIDALVNNAGITRDGLIMKMTDDDFDEVMGANLYAAWAMARAVCRPMCRARRGGRIVNMSSVVALMGNVAQTNYAASKAGLIGLTKSLARELAPRGITANAVAPGFIDTKMTQVLSEEWKKNLLAGVPLGSFGTPEDVAAATRFFLSDGARYITGQVLAVDGGMRM